MDNKDMVRIIGALNALKLTSIAFLLALLGSIWPIAHALYKILGITCGCGEREICSHYITFGFAFVCPGIVVAFILYAIVHNIKKYLDERYTGVL